MRANRPFHLWMSWFGCLVLVVFAACNSPASLLGDGDGDGGDGETRDESVSDDGADQVPGDSAPPQPWAWCPTKDAYQGGEWPWRVRVTDQAFYCTMPEQSLSLVDGFRRRARLRFVAGEYPIPVEGQHPFRLPLCLEFPGTNDPPAEVGLGEVLGSESLVSVSQPVKLSDGTSRNLTFGIEVPPHGQGAGIAATLDGTIWRWSYPKLCETTPDECYTGVFHMFNACAYPEAPLWRTVIDFTGGHLELERQIADTNTSVLGAFTRATGTLDGRAFVQTDYFRLGYTPGQHHTYPQFLVLFDQAIGQACGLQIVERQERSVSLIRCDLSMIEARAATLWDCTEYFPDGTIRPHGCDYGG